MALAFDPMCVKALYRRGTALAMMGRWADSVKGEPNPSSFILDEALVDCPHSIIDLTALVKLCPDDQLSKNALETALKKAAMSVAGGKVTKEATKVPAK